MAEDNLTFFNNSKIKLFDLFKKTILENDIQEVCIASAFFSFDKKTRELLELLNVKKISTKIIVGSAPYNLIRKDALLLNEYATINKLTLQISCYKPTQENPTFHSKFYIFKNQTHKIAIFGSSNMTSSGFSTTYESNIITNNPTLISMLEEEFNCIPIQKFLPDLYSEKITGDFEKQMLEAKLKPYEYQNQIINIVLDKFKGENKGKIILPCGVGKTLISLWIKEGLGADKIIFFLPSLSLLKQTFEVWDSNRNKEYSTLAICSDNSMSIDDDEYNILSSDLKNRSLINVTTKTAEIVEFLDKNKNFVIFCTYHSSGKLVEALDKSSTRIDFTIYDESHNVAQAKSKEYTGFFIKSHNVKSTKKLFMTATPKIITANETVKKEFDIFSMDDEKIFGKPFYSMSFRDAINNKEIPVVDYRIVLIDLFTDKSKLKFLKEVTELDIKQTAVLELFNLKKEVGSKFINPIKHILSYHSSIALAKQFIDPEKSNLNLLMKEIDGNIEIYFNHVNGSQKADARAKVLTDFENSERAILTNVRCLNEGIDAPKIDAIFFSDPKTSTIDIVQAIGRALRAYKSNPEKIAYVIVPIYDGEDGFGNLINVLNALRSVDEPLNKLVSEIDLANRKNNDNNKLMDKLIEGYIDIISSKKLNIAEINNLKDSLILHITDKYDRGDESFTGQEIGFWKRLAENDVNPSSSPGQIIIPLKYQSFFPDLEKDKTDVGSRQESKIFDIIFKDGDKDEIVINGVRIIKYIPAPNHPRKNVDLRFTFRNKGFIRKVWEVGDLLIFKKTNDRAKPLHIQLLKSNSLEMKKYPFNSLSKKYGYLI